MKKLSTALDEFRKEQRLKKKLDDNDNKLLNHLVGEIQALENEVDYYREEQSTGEFADFNGDVLQSFK